ncbi:MAG TPA: hypothetical protein VFL57_22185 [Bryobacteraceae bacterium]|nr:hypothetical protein [Bryobacteraceae bacterium]
MRTPVLLTVLLSAAQWLHAERFEFSGTHGGEGVAELSLSSPGSDWSEAGREAAVATVVLDGKHEQHVMLFAGERPFTYRVFLGPVLPGDHELTIERNERYSAPRSGLTVHNARFQIWPAADPYAQVLAHAPVLFARQNTIGQFSDVPLLAWCQKLDGDVLQYTVIFSNEDGGTSTRALMARWGRTTDIEYVYRVQLSPDGRVVNATIQGRDHKDLPFEGQRFSSHPLLIPVTDNNMVSGEATSAIRYQLAPALVKLEGHSREQMMDDHPITYEVAAKELLREHKIRPFGVAAGESISDPRNYLYIEYAVATSDAAVSVTVRRKTDRTARNSSLGRIDYAIDREDWVRTAVELPPETSADDLWDVSFDCIVGAPRRGEPLAHSGTCDILNVSKMFFLTRDYRPGPNLWKAPARARVRTGESAVFLGWQTSGR